MDNVFKGVSALLVVWGGIFFFTARNAPVEVKPKPIKAMLTLLAREKLAWILSAFYFLTFGGFVAFSIYLPSLLKDQFGLQPADAGLRTAGFVVLATLFRPVGGWLSDRIGGARVLSVTFFGIVPFALLLGWTSMIPFTVGALGCAVLLGLGNGAVFKLVPQYFPTETGTVTGMVGAMGGMGGFFPPLLLGFFRDTVGAVWPGFVLLAAAAFVLWRVNAHVFLPSHAPSQAAEDTTADSRGRQQLRAGAWATLWTGLLVASIVVGSRNLENFDPALVIYTFAVVFATWGVVYHYNVWLDKPPTRVYWDRGWQIVRQRGLLWSLPRLLALTGRNIVAQTFIRKRSLLRWWMHQCIFWGCILAMAITFPLVFGWISFKSRPDDQMMYVTYLFGFAAGEFQLGTPLATLLFHGLDVAAVLVLIGIALSLWRRMRDAGALTLQSFANDLFPLFLLFAISVTGLALTVSQVWLRGQAYSFVAILHAITVIAGLLYMPFGKFFHVFQRPAQLGVKLYHEVGAMTEAAECARCAQKFASRMHIDDLTQKVLPQVGFRYRMSNGSHWQDLCPSCKRKSLSTAHLKSATAGRGPQRPTTPSATDLIHNREESLG
jgi:MFS transporter, NNP family, nitrate/nitrite transporter